MLTSCHYGTLKDDTCGERGHRRRQFSSSAEIKGWMTQQGGGESLTLFSKWDGLINLIWSNTTHLTVTEQNDLTSHYIYILSISMWVSSWLFRLLWLRGAFIFSRKLYPKANNTHKRHICSSAAHRGLCGCCEAPFYESGIKRSWCEHRDSELTWAGVSVIRSIIFLKRFICGCFDFKGRRRGSDLCDDALLLLAGMR